MRGDVDPSRGHGRGVTSGDYPAFSIEWLPSAMLTPAILACLYLAGSRISILAVRRARAALSRLKFSCMRYATCRFCCSDARESLPESRSRAPFVRPNHLATRELAKVSSDSTGRTSRYGILPGAVYRIVATTLYSLAPEYTVCDAQMRPSPSGSARTTSIGQWRVSDGGSKGRRRQSLQAGLRIPVWRPRLSQSPHALELPSSLPDDFASRLRTASFMRV
ncbi:hypothetical protein FKP32DRAFT_1167601 [Trametes sanguinea]|nr:hypothetical protein FKP32DRAFT_1167601 [Trametes sanguinea]